TTLSLRVRAAFRMGVADHRFQDEGFLLVQQTFLNDTAYAIAELANRFGSGKSALAKLVREQQDLMNRGIETATLLRDNYSPDSISRTEQSEEALQALRARQDKTLDVIEARLKTEFPEFNALAYPKPLSIAEAQDLLASDEVFIQFYEAKAAFRSTG